MWWGRTEKKGKSKRYSKATGVLPYISFFLRWYKALKVLVTVIEIIRVFRGYQVADSAACTLLPHLLPVFFTFMGVPLYSSYSEETEGEGINMILIFSLLFTVIVTAIPSS